MTGYVLAKFVPAVLMLLTVPFLLDLYGDREYGVYSQVWALASAGAGFSVGWIRQAELRYAGDPERTVAALHPVAVVTSIALAGLIGLVAGLYVGSGSISLSLLWWSALFAAALALYSIRLTISQRNANIRRFNSAEIIRTALGLGISLIMVVFVEHPVAWHVMSSLLAGYVIGALILPGMGLGRPYSRKVTQAFFAFGWPMSVWLGVSSLVLYVDRILLQGRVEPAILGQYSAASDLMVRGMTLIGAPILLFLHPRMMAAANSGNAANAIQASRIWTVGGLVLVSGLAAIAVPSSGLISELTNITGVPPVVFALLVLGGGLWQVAQIAHKPLEIHFKTRLMAAGLVGSLLLEFALMIPAIVSYGIVGAAACMVLGPGTYVLFCFYATKALRLRNQQVRHS